LDTIIAMNNITLFLLGLVLIGIPACLSVEYNWYNTNVRLLRNYYNYKEKKIKNKRNI